MKGDVSVRDPATFDEIVRHLRDFWSRSPDVSVARLIHSAVEPVVANEIRDVSDSQLLQKLRAMAHFAGTAAGDESRLNAEHLAALDEARDYNAASSYNWLRAELSRLRKVVSGGTLSVADGGRTVILASCAEFDAWVKRRYPGI